MFAQIVEYGKIFIWKFLYKKNHLLQTNDMEQQ